MSNYSIRYIFIIPLTEETSNHYRRHNGFLANSTTFFQKKLKPLMNIKYPGQASTCYDSGEIGLRTRATITSIGNADNTPYTIHKLTVHLLQLTQFTECETLCRAVLGHHSISTKTGFTCLHHCRDGRNCYTIE